MVEVLKNNYAGNKTMLQLKMSDPRQELCLLMGPVLFDFRNARENQEDLKQKKPFSEYASDYKCSLISLEKN